MKQTQEAELNKARFLASEARGRFTQALLTIISQAKKRLREDEGQTEKIVYSQTFKDFIAEISESL